MVQLKAERFANMSSAAKARSLGVRDEMLMEALDPGIAIELVGMVSLAPRVTVTTMGNDRRRILFDTADVVNARQMLAKLQLMFREDGDSVKLDLSGVGGGAVDLILDLSDPHLSYRVPEAIRVIRWCLRACCPRSPDYIKDFDPREELSY